MKIVEPSYEIQHDLDNSSIAIRIETCGRVCYKSEDLISADSAIPFVSKIAEHGHNSVLEMAVVSFAVTCHIDHILEFMACQPKYFIIDRTDTGMLVTGSIRALREMYQLHATNQLVNDLVMLMAQKEPFLFENIIDTDKTLEPDPQINIRKLSLQEVDELSPELRRRHRYVSVRFIVNRAVTHELVRHRPCSFLQESQRYCRYSQDKFDNQVTFIKPMFYQENSQEYTIWRKAMEETEADYLKLLETSSPQAARTVLPNSCKTEIIVYCNLVEWNHIFTLRTSQAAEPSMREIMIPLAKEMAQRFALH